MPVVTYPLGNTAAYPDYANYKPSAYASIMGTRSRLNEDEYLRPQPGRTQPKIVKLLYNSKLVVMEDYVSEYNEVWYRVAVVLNGITYYGYLQAAAVDLGTVPTPTPARVQLTKDGVDYSYHYDVDKNNDGTYVVVLDPGHGGIYPGAVHFGTNEKDINLVVAKACKAYLDFGRELIGYESKSA